MKRIQRILAAIAALALLPALPVIHVSAADSDNYVAAHWKFQDEEGYYTGSADDDTLRFIDLTGNGNDLEVCSEGYGDELDIFEWDEGVELNDGGYTASSSLRFGNTWEKALSVDPYEPSLTEYSGAYVSGKYFQTVDGAPLNDVDSSTGWTVEIIFKIDEEWNNNYNRYTGLFSRQGVVESQDEPAFSMALTEMITGASDGYLGTEGTTGLQYVHVDVNEKKTNYEIKNGQIYGEQWMHFMVTSDGNYTEAFLNGESVFAGTENNEIYITDSLFSWEVGVGRKLGTDKATMNPKHPEGLIRRLFCGSISEIRFSMNCMDIEDSLYYQNLETEDETLANDGNPLLEANNIYDYWEKDLIDECLILRNQTNVEYTSEGVKFTGVTADVTDPYLTINLKKYAARVNAEPLNCEEYGFLVLKVKGEGTTGDVEIDYSSSVTGSHTEQHYFYPDGEWTYMIFDLSYYDDWTAERNPTSLRIDWATGYEDGVAAEDAYMILGAVAFFKTEDEANAFAGIVDVIDSATTAAPETQAPDATVTEAATQATTNATTEAPEAEGCSSVVGAGAALVLALSAATVFMRKRDED